VRVIHDCKYLAALYAVAFVDAHLDNVAHHLTSNLARLSGTHVPTASSQSGAVVFWATITENVVHVSVAMGTGRSSLVQPANIPLSAAISRDGIVIARLM